MLLHKPSDSKSTHPRSSLMPGVFNSASGRAYSLGGESPLLALQGEELANGKGFAGDCESKGSRMAKRWFDEQEVDMRRYGRVRSP